MDLGGRRVGRVNPEGMFGGLRGARWQQAGESGAILKEGVHKGRAAGD